jgi:hypothetical protein
MTAIAIYLIALPSGARRARRQWCDPCRCCRWLGITAPADGARNFPQRKTHGGPVRLIGM